MQQPMRLQIAKSSKAPDIWRLMEKSAADLPMLLCCPLRARCEPGYAAARKYNKTRAGQAQHNEAWALRIHQADE
jgi:hypothetical protein